jgi:hypothetical protein
MFIARGKDGGGRNNCYPESGPDFGLAKVEVTPIEFLVMNSSAVESF